MIREEMQTIRFMLLISLASSLCSVFYAVAQDGPAVEVCLALVVASACTSAIGVMWCFSFKNHYDR